MSIFIFFIFIFFARDISKTAGCRYSISSAPMSSDH